MSQFFYIHPDNPQPRLINQAVEIVRKGGVIVYPTDSGYALGCKIEDKGAMERICRIRQLPDGHNFTLMCRDLSELSTQALLETLGEPMLSTSLMLPGSEFTESDPEEIKDRLEKVVELIIHGGYLGQQPTTVVDLTEDAPEVIREGVGDVKPFL